MIDVTIISAARPLSLPRLHPSQQPVIYASVYISNAKYTVAGRCQTYLARGGSGGAGPREVTLRPRQSEPRSRRSIVFTIRIVAAEYDLLRRRRDVWPWNNVFGDLCGAQHENAAVVRPSVRRRRRKKYKKSTNFQ